MTLVPATSTEDQRWFSARLLDWYRAGHRDLPWRGAPSAYAVWVSEIMLQQTQVDTVRDYYVRWMRRFPTVTALADASEDAVLHAWQGLGYYSRARNLRHAAQIVVRDHDAVLPRDARSLLALPGIGAYSAGAIASIAYGDRAAIVDGNVTRLLCRFFGLAGRPDRVPLKAKLWELAEALIVDGAASEFNQAMMEMGAVCCTPRAPTCARCPLAQRCAALADGRVDTLPETPPRPGIEHVSEVVCIARRRGRVLLVQGDATTPRWRGLWRFPSVKLGASEKPVAAALRALAEASGLECADPHPLPEIAYSVTRYRVSLAPFLAEAGPGRVRTRPGEATRWTAPGDLGDLALPAPHRRLCRAIG